jgi:hypothetical protein
MGAKEDAETDAHPRTEPESVHECMIEVRSLKRVPGMNSGNSLRTNVPATVSRAVESTAVNSTAVAVSSTTVELAAVVLGSFNGRRTDG